MNKKNNNFGFSTGVVKVLETRLIDKSRLRTMIEMDLPFFLESLKEIEYGEFLNLAGDFNYEAALKKHWNFVKSLPFTKKISEIIFLKNEFLNLKSTLKKKIFSNEFTFENDKFSVDSFLNEVSKLKQFTSEEKKKIPLKYFKNIINILFAKKEFLKDQFNFDLLLEKFYFVALKEIVEEFKSPNLKKLLTLWIDLFNLSVFFRSKAFNRSEEILKEVLVNGGSFSPEKLIKIFKEDWEIFNTFLKNSKDYALFSEGVNYFLKEKEVDYFEKQILEFEKRFLKNASLFGVGPFAILNYALAKESEIKNIQIILTGKKSGLSPEKIFKIVVEN